MKAGNNTNIEITAAELYDYPEHPDYPASTVCTVQTRNLQFKLRGLCSDFSYDRDYLYTVEEDGSEVYKGKKNSFLSYNRTSKLWQLTNVRDNTSMLTSAAPWDSFMIGLQTFNFNQALEDKCFNGKNHQQFKFSSCPGGSFTCNDGRCIPMVKRCDQKAHCKDKSDESDCELIIMESYNKNIPPFIVDPITDEISAVRVNISSNVIDILKINEVEQSFELKMFLILTWYDDRLVYHNLKENRIANSPSFEVTGKLWIPKIIFDNTRNNDVMALDDLAKITISKQGKSTLSDETNVDEIEIFKGSENKIYFEKGFTKTVKCIYQLQLYPFDKQECTVNLQVAEYESNLIELSPNSIKMKSETLLTQFLITDWKLEFKNKGMSCQLHLLRKYPTQLLIENLIFFLLQTIWSQEFISRFYSKEGSITQS